MGRKFLANYDWGKTCFALTEHSSNLNLPDKVLEDPIIKGLSDAANDIICFINVVQTPQSQTQLDPIILSRLTNLAGSD